MYGVVLMMALSGGANGPAAQDVAVTHVAKYGDNGHKTYRGCHGGCRGCYGGGCHGCYGGWCGGCYGGCYGGYCGGCYGGCGGCYGCGCGGYGYGSYGGMSYVSGYSGYGGTYATMQPAGGYSYGATANGAAPATIVVRLPADATLTVDGAPTTSSQNVRTFVSPDLQPDKEYQYTLRAEATRDGKKVTSSKEVTVRAGRQSEVTIDLPSASE
jgi:uncharacterized protein (TIGR03000 family)